MSLVGILAHFPGLVRLRLVWQHCPSSQFYAAATLTERPRACLWGCLCSQGCGVRVPEPLPQAEQTAPPLGPVSTSTDRVLSGLQVATRRGMEHARHTISPTRHGHSSRGWTPDGPRLLCFHQRESQGLQGEWLEGQASVSSHPLAPAVAIGADAVTLVFP